MQRLHIEPLAGLSGVTRISVSRDLPHPQLAIVGAVHGNERCGRVALERLQSELSDGRIRLRAGSLFLVHGNPEASLVERRHSERGADLNRLFDYGFVHELAPAHWTLEHHRALALRPLFDSVDALLDLHSATAPTPPFAIASRVPASEPFAAALGLDYVTLGWDGPGLLGDQVSLAPLTRRQLPAVAVECGQHDDSHAPEVAYRCARAALAYFELIDESVPQRTQPPERLIIRAAVKRPSARFRFVRRLAGMEWLEAGDVIGQDDYLVMSVHNACRVIMPNDAVAVGDDLLYLAETW